MNWDFMSKMFYPKLGGNAVKWQVHKTQKPELNLSSQMPTLCLLGSLEDRKGPYGQEDREQLICFHRSKSLQS